MTMTSLQQSDLSPQTTTPELVEITGDHFRQAVVQAAATMECERYTAGGRLQKAMDLVLTPGAVTREANGVGVVRSGNRTYEIDPETGCTCQDAQHRSKWCKHATALELWKRATMRLGGNGVPAHSNGHAKGATVPADLTHHEAPVSANTYLMLAGHRVQVPVRSGVSAEDVNAVITNMERLLERFPAANEDTTTTSGREDHQTEDTVPPCPVHGAPMKRSQKFDGWYCPKKRHDGQYCKERA